MDEKTLKKIMWGYKEGVSGEMKLKYTKLNEGEQLIEGPFECKMWNTTRSDSSFKYAKNHSNDLYAWRETVAFITDKRIIVEDNSSETDKTTYSFFHCDIAAISGQNTTFTFGIIPHLPGILTIKFLDKYVGDIKLTFIDHASDLAEKLSKFYPENKLEERTRKSEISKAKNHERMLEFDEAVKIYQELGIDDEVIRIRKLKAGQGAVKVDQTVVHGDYVDDSATTTTYIDKRNTIVKDSVINRSNVGGSSSKMQELEKLTEMKEKGLIDDDEFKQMKKEILGK